MNPKHLIPLRPNRFLLTAVTSMLLTGAHARTWTSADGSKTFNGELKSYDAEKGLVTVTLANGNLLNFSQDKLSEADITFLKENGTKATASSSSSGSVKALPDVLPAPAGCQHHGDVAAAKKVLENLDTYYPGAKQHEVAGFFWWQGDKDMRNPAHYEQYEKNLVQLIKALRKDFSAPNARFVSASLGQTQEGSKGGDGVILDAMKAVAKSSDPELKGKVGFVYSHPLSKGGSSSGHYGGNPETYMNVGEAIGKAMVELLQGK